MTLFDFLGRVRTAAVAGKLIADLAADGRTPLDVAVKEMRDVFEQLDGDRIAYFGRAINAALDRDERSLSAKRLLVEEVLVEVAPGVKEVRR